MSSPPSVPDPPIDPSAYSNLDLLGTVQTIGPWWRLLVADLEPTVGFDELAATQADVLAGTLRRLAAEPEAGENDIDRLALRVHGVAAGRLAQPAVRAALDDLIVQSLVLLRQAGRTLAASGALGEPATGAVHGLFASGGGVPKLAIPSIEIGIRGATGDRQQTRRHHGRPWQAICLWSLESIERLAAEGHPIRPGSAGENICAAGLDWAAARPGTRMRIGDEAVLELSVFALPCRQNAQWFLDGDFMRMHHDREPGISRIYASVLQCGRVATGDAVALLP